MTDKRIVVKIGGSTLGQHDTTLEDLVWLQREGVQVVVVHGGGKTITQWLERLGVSSRFVDGLRVTDAESIDVVVATLAGLVNKQLVASLSALGGRAVGLSGADGAAVRARIKDPALGMVGEPTNVDAQVIETLLDAGYLPVIAPIGLLEEGSGPMGALLNINADTFAAEIGGAINAERFIFLTDVPGVRDESGAVFPALSADRARALMVAGTIAGGMVPKVEACLRALRHVPSSVIADGRTSHALRDSILGQAIGTRIEMDS